MNAISGNSTTVSLTKQGGHLRKTEHAKPHTQAITDESRKADTQVTTTKADRDAISRKLLNIENVRPQAFGTISPEIILADYTFNGNSFDASGNGHTCNVYGATLTSGKEGLSDTAYHFDGNDYLDCGHFSEAKNIQTIETWVKFDTHGSTIDAVVSQATSGNGIELILGPNQNGLHFYTMGNYEEHPITIPYSSLPFNTWTHIVATQAGEGGKETNLYLNGTKVVTGITPQTISGGPNFLIGRGHAWYQLRYFHGDIDEVTLYSQALTQAQITARFNQGAAVSESNSPSVAPSSSPSISQSPSEPRVNNIEICDTEITLPEPRYNALEGTAALFQIADNALSRGMIVSRFPHYADGLLHRTEDLILRDQICPNVYGERMISFANTVFNALHGQLGDYQDAFYTAYGNYIGEDSDANFNLLQDYAFFGLNLKETATPTTIPTLRPTVLSPYPTGFPTDKPSRNPSFTPSSAPFQSAWPSAAPSLSLFFPTIAPREWTHSPSAALSKRPSCNTASPTSRPSVSNTQEGHSRPTSSLSDDVTITGLIVGGVVVLGLIAAIVVICKYCMSQHRPVPQDDHRDQHRHPSAPPAEAMIVRHQSGSFEMSKL